MSGQEVSHRLLLRPLSGPGLSQAEASLHRQSSERLYQTHLSLAASNSQSSAHHVAPCPIRYRPDGCMWLLCMVMLLRALLIVL